jgi:hypothetical protein
MAIRVVLVDPKGKITRYPISKYWNLLEPGLGESIPACAGDWAKFAEVVVEMMDRQPLRIAHIGYHRLKIGDDGRPDPGELHEELALAVGTLGGTQTEGNLLDGHGLWSQKRLNDRFKWRPTPFQERMIRRLVLS